MRGSRTISLENFMRIADVLDVSVYYFLYESPDKVPLTECIQNVLNGKNEKQQEYLIHMLEEMAKGLDKLM